MDENTVKVRYQKLLREIPQLDCDIKVLMDFGKDPSTLEKMLEDKKEELTELSRKLYSTDIKEERLVLVVSAPSGAGKTTICKKVLELEPNLRFSVSYTTRSPRKGEQDGKDYHFISEDHFRNRIRNGEFIEWAENYGHIYGTSIKEIENSLANKYDVLLDVDPRGAKTLRKQYPDGIFIFILPPSVDVLKDRLRGRGSENEDILKIRIEKATDEISEVVWYDYVIFNDTVETSVDILRSIYVAEKNKRKRLQERIKSVINKRR